MKKNNSYMKFSNEEILRYFVEPLKKIKNIDLKINYDENIDLNFENSISNIILDGDEENLFISFYEVQTSIYFKENIEIMFIDENFKKNYTSSDTYDSIVYEENLNKMSHNSILHLFYEIISLFISASDAKFTYKKLNKDYKITYPRYEYEIKIFNKDCKEKYKKFSNIIFYKV